jgi:Tetratricopeptide repeat
MRRVLEIQELRLERDHRDIVWSLNMLGSQFSRQKEGWDEAKLMFERALAISERTNGPDHLNTAEILERLGTVLYHQQALAEARPLLERALAIRERSGAVSADNALLCLCNLGAILLQEGELAPAQNLFERAVVIKEESKVDDADAALLFYNLATLLARKGYKPGVRSKLEKSLIMRARLLGPNHPDTVEVVKSLADVLRDHDFEDDFSLASDVLTAWEGVLGVNGNPFRMLAAREPVEWEEEPGEAETSWTTQQRQALQGLSFSFLYDLCSWLAGNRQKIPPDVRAYGLEELRDVDSPRERLQKYVNPELLEKWEAVLKPFFDSSARLAPELGNSAMLRISSEGIRPIHTALRFRSTSTIAVPDGSRLPLPPATYALSLSIADDLSHVETAALQTLRL